MSLKGQSREPAILGQKYLKTVKDTGLVSKDHQLEMAYGESDGHVIESRQDDGLVEVCNLWVFFLCRR